MMINEHFVDIVPILNVSGNDFSLSVGEGKCRMNWSRWHIADSTKSKLDIRTRRNHCSKPSRSTVSNSVILIRVRLYPW